MTNKRVFRHFKFDAQRRRFEEGKAKRRKIAAMESTARGFGGSPLLRRVFWIECAQSGAAVFVVLLALAFLHVLSRLLPQIAVGAIPEAAFGWLALVGAVRYAPQLLMSSLFLGIVLAVDRARRDNETLAWATLGAGEPRFTREAVWFALPLVFFVGWLSLVGSPWAARAGAAQIEKLAREGGALFSIRGVFHHFRDSGFVYFFDPDNGRVFAARQKDGEYQVTLVEAAAEAGADGEPVLRLARGGHYRIPKTPPAAPAALIETILFEEMELPIAAPTASSPGARASSLTRLIERRDSDSGARAELARRLAAPLAALFFAPLAVFLARGPGRRARGYALVKGVVFCALAINALSFSHRLAQSRDWPLAVDALAAPLVLFALALAFARARRR